MNSLLTILLFEDYYIEDITLIKKTKLKQKKPNRLSLFIKFETAVKYQAQIFNSLTI